MDIFGIDVVVGDYEVYQVCIFFWCVEMLWELQVGCQVYFYFWWYLLIDWCFEEVWQDCVYMNVFFGEIVCYWQGYVVDIVFGGGIGDLVDLVVLCCN